MPTAMTLPGTKTYFFVLGYTPRCGTATSVCTTDLKPSEAPIVNKRTGLSVFGASAKPFVRAPRLACLAIHLVLHRTNIQVFPSSTGVLSERRIIQSNFSMKHIGGICDRASSHVRNLAAIGRELQSRGHKFTLFHQWPLTRHASEIGIPFCSIAAPSTSERLDRPQKPDNRRGVSVVRTNRIMVGEIEHLCCYGPDVVRSHAVDMLVVDQCEPGGATIAELIGIPFVSFCTAMPLNEDPLIPPSFCYWKFQDTGWARMRNRAAYRIRNLLLSPVYSALNRHRKRWGLPPVRTPDDSFSRLAQFTQLIPGFDYKYEHLPECFHYVGPYQRASTRDCSFPWHRLDGRP